jgi:YD repeat-containing protein
MDGMEKQAIGSAKPGKRQLRSLCLRGLLSIFVLLLSCCWAHAQYSYTRAITIDHTKVPNTDQTDFPVLVSGTYSYLATVAHGGKVQNANGYDIIFTSDSHAANKLDHEIESYDATTGTINFWVRIPTVSHTSNTVIYLVYGNSSITTSQENKTGVWRNGYGAVWHLSSNGAISAADSTGTNSGTISSVTAATGKINGAGSFTGSTSSYIRIPSSSSFKPSGAVTLEAWVNPTSITAWNKVISLDYRADGTWNSPYVSYAVAMNSSAQSIAFHVSNAGALTTQTSTGTISLNAWSHVVATFDTSSHAQTIYLNGTRDSTLTNNGTSIDYGTSQDLTLGQRSPYSTGEGWIGLLDEVRVSTVARSADWVTTEYNDQNSPSTFFSVGSESTLPSLSSIAVTPANPTVPKGLSQQFTATGTYSDNSTEDLSAFAAWASSQTTVATINSTGLATTLAQGNTSISATLGSVAGSTTLTVSPPAVASIAVTRGNVTVVQNATWQFTATGTYTDGSTQDLTGSATWGSSATAVATVNSAGLTTTLTPGTSNITAQSGSIIGSSTLTVVSSSTGPTISSISLSQAAVGGTVTITGTNFGSSQGFSVVTFNGVSAGLCTPTPACWSATSVAIKVPVGATSGNVVVNVKGVYSNGVNLTIVAPPVITGVTPFWIPVGGALNINGSSFGPSSSGTVTVSGTNAAITNWSGTAISVTVPSSISPSGSTQVVVNAEGLASQPFTFTTHPVPAIGSQPGSICLANGIPPDPANCIMQAGIGAQVYIIGSNLGDLQGDSTVSFGSVQATQIQQDGSGLIAATIPSGITPLPTTVNVVVNTDGLASASQTFTVTASPVISSLSVTTGGEGTPVTITGSNFGSTGTVTFNGTVATVQSGNWTSTQITTSVPVGASSGAVVVNASGIGSNGINFTVPPSITSSLNPSSGPVNTPVTISGYGFGSPQGTSTVTFNGTTAKITSWSDNNITALVPSIAAGSATVTVTVAGQNATASFTVTSGPSITSLSSTSGTTGSLIGINGSGFGSSQGSSVVRFNGASAQVCSSNCTASGCTANGWSNSCVPAYVPSSATTGPVTLAVSGQTATGPQFNVTGAGTGQISGTVTCGSGTITVRALRQGASQGSTTTACNGNYTISNLAADSYDVQASAASYGTATQNAISVTVGGNTSGINFSLSTAGTISGQITQASGGAAINGATVQVYVGSALVGSVNTGSGNSYTFNTLNAATYRVLASATGFVAQSQSVMVGAGGTVTQNFALQATGSTPITYSYDNLGRLIGVTDQSGDTATYNYDAVGNITSISRHNSSLVSLISIEPPSAHAGDTVTLTGTGFSTTASQDTVQFAGANTLASSATAAQIVVTVPTGAVTGTVAVNVNGTVSNSVPFTVLTTAGAPTITNVSPLIGVPGTSVTVTGTNFDPVISNDQLGLNTTNLVINPTGYSSTNISTSTPALATSGHATLATPGGTAVGSQDFIVVPPTFQASTVAYSARTTFPSSGSVSIGNVPALKVAMVLFDAVGGQKVNIKINTTNFTGCDMQVYAPNQGTTPIYSQFCPAAGNLTGAITLPATGTYTIVFHNYDSGSGGSTLTFTLYNATDFTSAITYGQSVTVSLSTVGQTGRLTFLANANQHVSVNVTAGLGSACNLSLLSPTGQSLSLGAQSPPYHFTPTSDCSTSGNFWDIGYLPSLTGVYTIVIAPQAGATLPASVTLQLLDSTDVAHEPITPNTSGSSVTVSTTVAGQNIQQVFSGTAGQKVSLKITALDNFNLSGHLDIWILGPGNVQVAHASSAINSSTLPYFFDPRLPAGYYQNAVSVLPSTGNYTIFVDPNDAAVNGTGHTSFTLYLAQDVTASTFDLTGLPFGSSVSSPSTPSATQTAPGQTVTFPFVANLGQSLAFELDDLNNIGCTFSVYDPNNQLLTSTLSGISYQNVACTTAGVFSDLTDPLPATGTYTLVLLPAMNTATLYNTGSFKLKLTNTQDNVYTITPSPSGTQLTVSNTVAGQNDVITFQGTANQQITLHVNSMSYNPTPRNSGTPNLVINGPAGPNSQQLASAYAAAQFQAGGTVGPITLPSNGTYTIFITPGGFSGAAIGSMTFTVTSQ